MYEKIQNILKLIYSKDGYHIVGVESILNFLCHLMFTHEWLKTNNMKVRSSLTEISQFDTIITICYLLYQSLKKSDKPRNLFNLIKLAE